MHETYEKNPREYPRTVNIAKDGTRVRSKSECIVYNALLDAGIPFRYDPVMSFRIVDSDGRIIVMKQPKRMEKPFNRQYIKYIEGFI